MTKQRYNKSKYRDVISRVPMLFMALTFVMSFVSCAPHKKLAYDFVRDAKGASVAFYLPNELEKKNIRKDCQIENLYHIETEYVQDTIEARTKIVNKIDDEMFLDILFSSFESTLKDYDLSLEYWENENSKADSLHWVVDLSHIEILEYIEYQMAQCVAEGNYEMIPSVGVNVAAWIDLVNGEDANFVYTEQSFYEQICDCYYTMDSLNNIILNAEYQSITIKDFYDFAVLLGKLYAGYSFDYFMNEYVREEMKKKGLEYSDDIYMRYDPYEMYIYYTGRDRLIEL